ncbi:MAG TPA: hypothetical protein VN631_01515 [Negativicutes bacterium]|nr:hypothetical protein [Negativicutes bacterium]
MKKHLRVSKDILIKRAVWLTVFYFSNTALFHIQMRPHPEILSGKRGKLPEDQRNRAFDGFPYTFASPETEEMIASSEIPFTVDWDAFKNQRGRRWLVLLRMNTHHQS